VPAADPTIMDAVRSATVGKHLDGRTQLGKDLMEL
jgi:hypothetical protein